MKIETPQRVGPVAPWLASLHRGNWVRGWLIVDPYGEKDMHSFARTRNEAWKKFCAPAINYPEVVPLFRKEGFKAVRQRARSKAHAFMHGKSDLANS